MGLDKNIAKDWIFEGENEIDFLSHFSTEKACYDYLNKYKWVNGFKCTNCGCTEAYNSQKKPHHKQCKACLRVISPKSNTLFHNVKFSIVKAFYIVFKMSATTKSISAEQLSKTVGINRKSALLFQNKVRRAMQSSGNFPLAGQVEVDEAFVGGKEEGKIGRGAEKKALVVVAIEKYGTTGIKRMYARNIENASTLELKKIFDLHISKEAKVLTDQWRSYNAIAEIFDITQEKSEPDKNFILMHRGIQQLKSWIRGIHHSVDKRYLQAYLDEFCYRINRSIHKKTIFDNLLQRMVKGEPFPKKLLAMTYCT
jgi:transposase-like protein